MASTPGLPQDSVLREANRPYFYRESYLPGATAQSHASNLLLLPNGDVLCAWFGGSMEGKPDISIYLSRLRAGEQSWSEAIRMTHDNTRSEQNPVLFRTPTGALWLLYTSQHAGNQDSAIVKHRISKDDGITWGKEEVLFSDSGIFIRQPLIVLDDGAWVIPVFKCRVEPGERWLGNNDISCVRVSRDEGHTWTESVIPESTGLDATGRRQGLYDDIGDGVDERQDQRSTEDGRESFWGAPRAPLCVAWSDDSGKTWERRVLEDGDGYCMTNDSEKKLNRELSYPSMVLGVDRIHIAYTFWRQRIKYVQLKDDFLTN
ncbi:hypothetical protein APSETT444_003388 [Aspergillus pseudonomiae]